MINRKNIPVSIENTGTLFIIEKGLDNKYGSISIRSGNRYLTSDDTCCYLSFKNKPQNEDSILDNFYKHSIFSCLTKM